MKNLLKNIFVLFLGVFVFLILNSNFCFADFDSSVLDSVPTTGANTKKVSDIAIATGYSTTTAVDILSRTIQIVLGLSGTIALVLIIISGISYLTSKGDPTKIKKSLNIMVTGFVGIILMVSAYTLSGYIIKQTQRISGVDNVLNDAAELSRKECSKITNSSECNSSNKGCIYFSAEARCIANNSIDGGSACDDDEECISTICKDGHCSKQSPIELQQTGCLLGNYAPREDQTKELLKDNLSNFCMISFSGISLKDGIDSNCDNNLKALSYTCTNGSKSNPCNICVRRTCSDVVFGIDCGSTTKYGGAYKNCIRVDDETRGSYCADK